MFFKTSKNFKFQTTIETGKQRKIIEMFEKKSAPIMILKLDLDFGYYWYQNQGSVTHYIDDLKSICYYSEPIPQKRNW